MSKPRRTLRKLSSRLPANSPSWSSRSALSARDCSPSRFLAGSAAYALGETLGWRIGLAERARRAPAFYLAIAGATLVGALLNFSPLDPIKALIFSAIVNGVVAVPIMVMIMHMASRRQVMGEFALKPWLKALGWAATAVMAAAAVGMFATWNA
jgi:Mn2+/Fe2+ NRAMP family transporter